MGWLFSTRWQTKLDLIQHLRQPDRFGPNMEMVRACVTGSRHWYLMRVRATGQHWIGLDLIRSGKSDGYGYKDIDESAGPCDVGCPLSYLSAPHAPLIGYAAQWRERVRAYHASRKAKPAPVAKAWISYCGKLYQLQSPAGARRGWHVIDVFGNSYRMQARQLSQAKPALSHEKAETAELLTC
jgi:hypothetical protein